MNERDVPRRRPGQGPDGSYDPYVDSYYESGYDDQTGSGRFAQRAMPADRGGSGPHFYDPAVTPGTRYSFGGNIKRPREILPGGYISFVDPVRDEVEQILFLGSTPQLRTLGSANGLSLRVFVDGKTWQAVRDGRKANPRLSKWCSDHRKAVEAVASRRAELY